MSRALKAIGAGLGGSYVWRQTGGELCLPSEMKARHLFHTLRMIWNHKMPEAAKLHPYREYRFGEFYTDEYLKLSIRHLAAELAARSDMTNIQKYELKQMLDYLAAHRIDEQNNTRLARQS